MARTSKTKIGSHGEQAERTTRAAAQGAEFASRAHGELLQQYRTGQQQAMQGAELVSGMDERRKARNEQSRQFDAEMAQRREFETGRQALDQQQIDLRAAEQGYQRTGATGSPLLDQRMQKLQSEMDRGAGQPGAGGQPEVGPPTPEQQRRADQMGKGVEMPGAHQPFVPTAEGKAAQRMERFKADTQRMQAEAYREQVKGQLLKAQLQGDEEGAKNLKANLMKPINSDAKLLEDFASGKFNDKSWDSVEAMVADVPDPELRREVEQKVPGPRLRSFLSAKVAFGALNYIKDTGGDMPDAKVVDFTSPQMQQFTGAVKQTADLIGQMGAEFGQFLGLRTLNDKIRFQNEMAAKMVLSGMTAKQASAQGPFGEMSPSTGGVQFNQQAQQPPAPGGPEMAPQRPSLVDLREGRGLTPEQQRTREILSSGPSGFGVR